jgi:hypothetical protein
MYSVISITQELMQDTLDDEELARDLDQKHAQNQYQAEFSSLSAEVDDVWEDLTGDFFTTLFNDLAGASPHFSSLRGF